MGSKRRLRLESLEDRRLLAWDVANDLVDVEPAVTDVIDLDLNAVHTAALSIFPPLLLGADYIHEVDGRVVVVDSSHYSGYQSHLWVFDRAADGSLDLVKNFAPGFDVQELIVQGDQAILIGSYWPVIALDPWDYRDDGVAIDPNVDRPLTDVPEDIIIEPPYRGPSTMVTSVPLVGDAEPTKHHFDGFVREKHHDGDRLVLIFAGELVYPAELTDDSNIDPVDEAGNGQAAELTIWPPPVPITQIDQVRVFDISSSGLVEVARGEISPGQTTLVGNQLLSTSTEHTQINYFAPPGDDAPLFTNFSSVTQYEITDDGIREVAKVDLGEGGAHRLHQIDETTFATLRRQWQHGNTSTSVDILDLSDGTLSLFDSIALGDTYAHVLGSVGSTLVISDGSSDGGLILIETNTLIDIGSEGRVRRVELGSQVHVRDLLAVTDDLFVMTAVVFPPPDNTIGNPRSSLRLRDHAAWRAPDNVLLTVSVGTAEVIARRDLASGDPYGSQNSLVEIDATTGQFGIFNEQYSATGEQRGVLEFGGLDDQGEFVADGEIVGIGSWPEFDATTDRLLVRSEGTLTQYDWNDPATPVFEIPLVDPTRPPIEAVDDHFTIDSPEDGELLRVLANDTIPPGARPHIVDLIDAPEGAEIHHGKAIYLPASAMARVDQLRFQYVVTDGVTESTATVTADIIDETDRLTAAIREQAAEDFGVPIDDVVITLVSDWDYVYTQEVDPTRYNGPAPGIRASLTVNDQIGLYFADFLTGTAKQIYVTDLDRPNEPVAPEEIERLGEVVRAQAAEDLGVPVSQVEIRLNIQSDLLKVPNSFGPDDSVRPGLELIVTSNTMVGWYFIDFDTGTPVQVHVSELELPPDDVLQRMVDSVRAQAAEDFGVSVGEIEVTFVERLGLDELQATDLSPSGILSPGLLVTLKAPNMFGLYFIDFATETPSQIYASGLELMAALGVRAVGDDGSPLTEVQVGQSFWLEFYGQDLRRFGTGIYAAFFDLVVPDNLQLNPNEVQFGQGFTSIAGGSITSNEVDDTGAAMGDVNPPGNVEQVVMRIAAEAIAVGEVTLEVNESDRAGTETLLYGRDEPVASTKVEYLATTFTVIEPPTQQRDTNGDGVVTPIDALGVLNFLNVNGILAASSPAEGEEGSGPTWLDAKHLDANGDDMISPLDSLVIMNYLNDELTGTAESTEPATVAPASSSADGDEDEEAGEGLVEELKVIS